MIKVTLKKLRRRVSKYTAIKTTLTRTERKLGTYYDEALDEIAEYAELLTQAVQAKGVVPAKVLRFKRALKILSDSMQSR